MRPLVFLAFAASLAGCPPSEVKKREEPPSVCTRFGQNCEVSPGKLGTCVVRDDCTDAPPACFVCQSQH